METILKPYKRGFSHSYASGSYATRELLLARPEQTQAVYLHPNCRDETILPLCLAREIPVHTGSKPFARINQKENCYALGVFAKYESAVRPSAPHIVLAGIGDNGNLGTILRIAAAMGMADVALISPAADLWHPKTIRASMGALFQVNVSAYPNIFAYHAAHPAHVMYPFMLDGEHALDEVRLDNAVPYALVFGGEWTGLSARYHALGKSVRIPQTERVDSLNLAIAVGIGVYAFSRK